MGTAPAEPHQLSILPRAKRAAAGSRGNGRGRARAQPYLWQGPNTALIAAALRKLLLFLVRGGRQFERVYPGSPVSANLHRGAEPTAPRAAARGRLRFRRKKQEEGDQVRASRPGVPVSLAPRPRVFLTPGRSRPQRWERRPGKPPGRSERRFWDALGAEPP